MFVLHKLPYIGLDPSFELHCNIFCSMLSGLGECNNICEAIEIDALGNCGHSELLLFAVN